jgi:hypothetical protein
VFNRFEKEVEIAHRMGHPQPLFMSASKTRAESSPKYRQITTPNDTQQNIKPNELHDATTSAHKQNGSPGDAAQIK